MAKSLKQYLSQQLNEVKFTIPMVADSTTLVTTDIRTRLSGGKGWWLEELVYLWEKIDATAAHSTLQPGADSTTTIQLQRGDAHTAIVNANDVESMLTHIVQWDGGASHHTLPFRAKVHQVTTQKIVRIMFRTGGDHSGISDPSVHLSGKLLYREVSGPDVGNTKLGKLGEF